MPWQRQQLGVGPRRGPSGQAGKEPWEDTAGDTGGHAEPQQRAGELPVTLQKKRPRVLVLRVAGEPRSTAAEGRPVESPLSRARGHARLPGIPAQVRPLVLRTCWLLEASGVGHLPAENSGARWKGLDIWVT